MKSSLQAENALMLHLVSGPERLRVVSAGACACTGAVPVDLLISMNSTPCDEKAEVCPMY